MSVTNYWKHFYLNSEGKLKRRKKIAIPRYLRRTKSFSENQSPSRINNPSVKTSTFRGWNRSAYFRFRANQDLISNLDNTENSKAQSLPTSGYRKITRTKSKKRKLTPSDLLAKLKPQLKGEVVLATSNLVVTRTSPTPEETTPIKLSPSSDKNLKVSERHFERLCGSKSRKYETFREVYFFIFPAALAPLDCSNQNTLISG